MYMAHSLGIGFHQFMVLSLLREGGTEDLHEVHAKLKGIPAGGIVERLGINT